MLRTEEESAASRRGEKSPASEARTGEARSAPASVTSSAQGQSADGDPLPKYVVLYALTMLLHPLLTGVLTLVALWGLWRVLLWVFLS